MHGAKARADGRGALIVFEGGDRCGKTTQSKKLVAALQEKGVGYFVADSFLHSSPILQASSASLSVSSFALLGAVGRDSADFDP